MERKNMKSTITAKPIYYLDEFDNPKFGKLVPVTEKNRDFIEGCIRIDSNYKNTLTNFVKDMVANYNYTTILAALKEINKINSTRLSGATMERIAKGTLKEWPDINSLVSALDGSVSGAKSLFEGIVKSARYDVVSFASKVIFYLSDELNKLGRPCNAHKQYSKYDSKVAACLAAYIDVYDILPSGKRYYKTWFTDKHHKKFANLWDFYAHYNDCLGALLRKVQIEHSYIHALTRAELDHVIWYTQK